MTAVFWVCSYRPPRVHISERLSTTATLQLCRSVISALELGARTTETNGRCHRCHRCHIGRYSTGGLCQKCGKAWTGSPSVKHDDTGPLLALKTGLSPWPYSSAVGSRIFEQSCKLQNSKAVILCRLLVKGCKSKEV